MENKQLNFSAPLLSARRYSSPLRSSLQENPTILPEKNRVVPSNSKQQVLKPASVPFLWEQIPGRPKKDHQEASAAAAPPHLPPGARSGDLTSFYRSQNRLSGELNSINRFRFSGELIGFASRNRSSRPIIPTNEMAMRALLMDGDKINGGRCSESDNDDEDGDTAFSDAVDALESFSIKCSTNASDSIVEETLLSSSEAENRDFMINRFLPAAKAMTLDSSSPHYNSKKQLSAVVEPPSTAIIPKMVKPTDAPNRSMVSLYYNDTAAGRPRQDIETDHDDSSDDARNNNNKHARGVTLKSCGFFPWFCSKNALRLLNPVPATRNAFASATKVGRNLVKNASPARSFSKQQHQHVSRTSRVHKGDLMTKSCELRRMEETQPPPYYKPRPMFYSGELPSSTRSRSNNLQARNGHLSPYRNYRRSCVSPTPCRNESPRYNNNTYFIVPKLLDKPPIDNILSNRRNHPLPPPQASPVMEKILYVDSSSAKLTKSRQSSGRMDILKARGINKPLACHSLDPSPPPPVSPFKKKKKKVNSSKEMVPVLRSDDSNNKHCRVAQPPPLPKSPSESWLSRNLNSVSPRSSFATAAGGKVLQQQSRKQSPVKSRPPPVVGNVNWETIVKTSYLLSDHGLYPEEPVTQVLPK